MLIEQLHPLCSTPQIDGIQQFLEGHTPGEHHSTRILLVNGSQSHNEQLSVPLEHARTGSGHRFVQEVLSSLTTDEFHDGTIVIDEHGYIHAAHTLDLAKVQTPLVIDQPGGARAVISLLMKSSAAKAALILGTGRKVYTAKNTPHQNEHQLYPFCSKPNRIYGITMVFTDQMPGRKSGFVMLENCSQWESDNPTHDMCALAKDADNHDGIYLCNTATNQIRGPFLFIPRNREALKLHAKHARGLRSVITPLLTTFGTAVNIHEGGGKLTIGGNQLDSLPFQNGFEESLVDCLEV